jgi:hypothetical protein
LRLLLIAAPSSLFTFLEKHRTSNNNDHNTLEITNTKTLKGKMQQKAGDIQDKKMAASNIFDSGLVGQDKLEKILSARYKSLPLKPLESKTPEGLRTVLNSMYSALRFTLINPM